MSIHLSYFSKNNTIIYNSLTNTGRNPIVELYYGSKSDVIEPKSFSRFIFDLDLSLLESKINSGIISTGCTNTISHKLIMKNTCSFDKSLLNSYTTAGKLRATSFDLYLFRIPLGFSGLTQNWDEGVGYDYIEGNTVINTPKSSTIPNYVVDDKAYSTRPSNWFQTTTLDNWATPGIYNNTNTGTGFTTNFSGLSIIDVQHFQFGDEDIEFDMTNEINSILDGSLTGVTGWGVCFDPQLENITGLTESYSVGFFSRHTNTFYEPYLYTTYDDLVSDDRNLFSQNKINKLYLFLYDNGQPINLDQPPVVTIYDSNDDPLYGYTGLTTCIRTQGVYEVTIPPITGYTVPCQFNDVWDGLVLNGVPLPSISNEFILYPYTSAIQIGTESKEHDVYGFDFWGIKQDEKILNTDLRKVSISIKRPFTSHQQLQKIDAFYRVYVREGQTEVQVEDWTKLNKTSNEYYLMFDTRDKIPNEYYIDMKVIMGGQIDTYKRTLKFQIVNKK